MSEDRTRSVPSGGTVRPSPSPGVLPTLTPSRAPDFQNTQGIIFVVDSNDRERVSEAREELQRMLNEDELRDALLLVFANKQDLPNAMNAAEITDKLGLHSLRQRTWYIQATCATSGDGLYEGLEWVSRRAFLPFPSLLRRASQPFAFSLANPANPPPQQLSTNLKRRT